MSARNRAAVAFSTTITLSETQVRALDGLTGYGFDSFIKVFKEKLGAVYIRDHEEGLRSFFFAVREQVLPALDDIDQARKDLRNAQIARHTHAQRVKFERSVAEYAAAVMERG